MRMQSFGVNHEVVTAGVALFRLAELSVQVQLLQVGLDLEESSLLNPQQVEAEEHRPSLFGLSTQRAKADGELLQPVLRQKKHGLPNARPLIHPQLRILLCVRHHLLNQSAPRCVLC